MVVGYANHELLCLGAASVNAIASGTWMNVRAFSPDRFLSADEDEIKRNGWLTVQADVDLIFNVPPEARYDAAMHALGVNAANLSEEAGHA